MPSAPAWRAPGAPWTTPSVPTSRSAVDRGAPACHCALPGLADQVLAETAVRLGGHQHETGILINLARGEQNALGPQRDLAIAAGLRKRDAFADQPFAQSLSASGRIDQQQTQFGDIVGMPDQKYRADLDAVDIGDPAAFPRSIERGEIFCRDLRDQAFERGVEAVFAGIE